MGPLPRNLLQVLSSAATSFPDRGISVYHTSLDIPVPITYLKLFEDAQRLSHHVRGAVGINDERIVLVHLDNHLDNIRWLWAVIATGHVPAMSSPLASNLEHRRKHILHLNDLLKSPIIITKRCLVPEFLNLPGLCIYTIEDLMRGTTTSASLTSNTCYSDGHEKTTKDLAVLMLTSGSTGNAKAVALRHGQIIQAISAKSLFHGTKHDDIFLNWIGMDHVANLTEIHLHAIALGANQVHVPADHVIAKPLTLLQLISRHMVTYTFAPNFFLAALQKSLEFTFKNQPPAANHSLPNVSSIRHLISGGEANSTKICVALTQLLGRLDAPAKFIRPGFGMTETCAGSIYNKDCPEGDLQHEQEFTSLGKCIPGMKMRVSRTRGSGPCHTDEIGMLQIHGANVFTEYYNNAEATSKAFTDDGWFITGDLAHLDHRGNLHLVGRGNDTININGIKHFAHEIEMAIEQADIPGVTASYVAVFPHRIPGEASETFCVAYLPGFKVDDANARANTHKMIVHVAMKHCTARPHLIIPLDRTLMPKSSLGKISRVKLGKAFAAGEYSDIIQQDKDLRAQGDSLPFEELATATQAAVRDALLKIFDIPPSLVGLRTSFFDLGGSSVHLFQFKHHLQNEKGLPKNIPIPVILQNPTVECLAVALESQGANRTTTMYEPYDPVVVLRKVGRKQPLWLIHSTLGEVLGFLDLAKHFTDRPVYAIRARGFEGEPYFANIEEMVKTYTAAVQKLQPNGPYAIGGFSGGAAIAFEMAKMLEKSGHKVPFLGVFDHETAIAESARQVDWIYALHGTARLFNLFENRQQDQAVASQMRQAVGGLGDDSSQVYKQTAVEVLLASTSKKRLDEYRLDKDRLVSRADVAYNLNLVLRNHFLDGLVSAIDVLHGMPPFTMGLTEEEWVHEMTQWERFTDSIHLVQVAGDHHTLINPENAKSFYLTLKERMEARGV